MIATGGTGGHIYPALALADTIRKNCPECEIRFFGSDNRMEAQVIPAAGYAFAGMTMSGMNGGILAKVKSLLRRYQEYRGKPASSIWTCGNLEVDLGTRMVRNAGENVPLTDTEYSILECLVKNRGRTVTTQELYETVWNEKFLPGSGNTIMVHVLNLRRKIEEVPSSPKVIRTVWGRGYQVD